MKLKFKNIIVLFLLFICTVYSIEAQVDPTENTVEGTENTSDQQLFTYYKQLKTQGYSEAQIKALAEAKGVSADKMIDFESRILALDGAEEEFVEADENSLDIEDEEMSIKKRRANISPRSEIFGKSFFSNRNISFAPNLNLSTPVNYKLGPGDKLVISTWGASERTYNVSVNREGAIRIPNIGPIMLNGLTIEDATNKIKGGLKRIFSGIDAPENSPYKINLGVSLSSVRTVQINIIGEVDTPGTYSLSSLSTVLNALYAAGGPTDEGTFRDIKLVRNGQETVSFDMYKYLIEGSQDGNIIVRDQDVIIVSPYLSRVSISGSIKRPGKFELKPEETLSSLLKFTSGFTALAHKEIVTVERIAGDTKRIVEIDLKNANSEKLKDGDYIEVKSILGGFENKVQIEGAIVRPGIFELTEGLTISQLIEKADGVLEKAFLNRAIVLRSIDGVSAEIIPFSVSDVLENGKNDIKLKNNDVVKIYDKYKTKQGSSLTISGAVINPKRIKFVENVTVEDMVLVSGGFTNYADKTNIDIYRKIIGEKTEKLVETINMGSEGLTAEIGNSASSFILKPNDRISVRYLKGFKGELFVSVNGEINFAGTYGLENKKMRISDLIALSGGVTDYAFVGGASLSRRNPYFKEKAQKSVVGDVKNNLSEDDQNIKLNNVSSLQVGIDLEKILKNPGSKYDMILKNGDELNIPSIKQTVKVDGEILVPSLIRFDESHNLKDYINSSGGFAQEARKGKTYVVYLNGSIAATKRFLFFRSYPKMEAGALVIVPKKVERTNRRLSTSEIIGVSTGFTTLALLIQNLTSN